MGKRRETIDQDLADFIRRQHLFFVASAPLAGDGHVNLSPKGLDTLRILGPDRIAYLDLTGSGNETAAHLAENGRLTIMFCAFEGRPKILRLYGSGVVHLPGSEGFERLRSHFGDDPGERQVIELAVERIQTSCGFGVPLFEYLGERDTLHRWAESKGEEGLAEYRAEKNAVSLDGLPCPTRTR